ncbi:sigma intracellular receptor 2-like isoform X2 [Ylistrum balloti]|uniref:sigma intracellular receptor 2-like isoform X2 n=1 Tax=Ylistrum balloti TaxID=509963 RepID=UPI002905B51E|nr:sigma intracellular receptor 2-like isoform X2 [Ylistrum balloti]
MNLLLVLKVLSNLYLRDLMTWYCAEFKDPMMAAPPTWFKTFVMSELTLQFPFFFVASYAFWKGVQQCRWIRIPLIVYSSHVATTTVAICYHVLMHDFSGVKPPGPETFSERRTLFFVYFPYLLVPIMLLMDSLFSSVYRTKVKSS